MSGISLLVVASSPQNKNKAPTTPKLFKPNNNTAVRDCLFDLTVCVRHSPRCQREHLICLTEEHERNGSLFSERPESEFSLSPARLATKVIITGAHGYTPFYSALHQMNKETPFTKTL